MSITTSGIYASWGYWVVKRDRFLPEKRDGLLLLPFTRIPFNKTQ